MYNREKTLKARQEVKNSQTQLPIQGHKKPFVKKDDNNVSVSDSSKKGRGKA